MTTADRESIFRNGDVATSATSPFRPAADSAEPAYDPVPVRNTREKKRAEFLGTLPFFLPRSGVVPQLRFSLVPRAIGAAEDPVSRLDAVADDHRSAVVAARGERVDRALEGIEDVHLGVPVHF